MPADAAQATRGSLHSPDGTNLAYRAWLRPHAAEITFAVVHGHGEHSGRYQRFAEAMARYEMATYALDLRGHGDSAGRRGHVDSWSQWVDDTVAFISLVEGQTKGEVIPVGHSFGGVVMLSAVRSGRLQGTKRFVLSSPALRLTAEVPGWQTRAVSLMSAIQPKLALSNNVDPRTISRIPEEVEAYRTDPLVHNRITTRLYTEWRWASSENLKRAGDITIPFLILAGTADRLIDPAVSRELHERAPHTSDLRMLEGRYHEPFNDLGSDEVFEMIAAWVRKGRSHE